jgi:hypothetical protein
MKVHLLNARISFAQGLWEKSAINDGKPKYGADFILAEGSSVMVVKEDGSKVKTTMDKVMSAVAKQIWQDKGEKVLAALEPSKKCYRDGDLRVNDAGDVYEGYEGAMYVTAKNPSKPTVIDRSRQPLTEEDGKPYSGCYVNAIIDVYAMKQGEKKGVFATLTGVQFVKDGDAFSGGRAADADEFEELESEELDGASNDDDELFD